MKDPACGVRAGPLSCLWFCFPLPGVPSSKHWENWLHCSPIAFYYEFHPHSPLPSLTLPALTLPHWHRLILPCLILRFAAGIIEASIKVNSRVTVN